MIIRVSSRGRITIPATLRRKLGVKAGTRIHFKTDAASGRLILTPFTREHIHNLRGKYRGKGLLAALMKERQAERRQ